MNIDDYDIGENSDEDEPIRHLPSPQVKPASSMKPPALGSRQPVASKGFGTYGVQSGMGKKVFSMVDLSSSIAQEEDSKSKEHAKHSSKHHGHQDDLDYSSEDDSEDGIQTLDHTAGTVHQVGGGMKRSQSVVELKKASNIAVIRTQEQVLNKQMGRELLVIFDMDHTMVGDLVSLSDRDNIETNVPWVYWPEGKDKGLSPEFILPFLRRGMLRPGLVELLTHLRSIGATVVVYTHSEHKWASKVCRAMEDLVGWSFIRRLYSRSDCRDGHPEFTARKSIQFVVDDLRRAEGLSWATVDRTIMFDDDGEAVGSAEQSRLVKVASYDYWEPVQWDEVVNQEVLSRNSKELADIVLRSVVEWGIGPPSLCKTTKTAEDAKRDAVWKSQLLKRHQILLAYNKVARLDRVLFGLQEAFRSTLASHHDLEMLPERARLILGNSSLSAGSRRQPK